MIGIRYDDENLQAILTPTTDEYRQATEIGRRWNLAGYVPSDPPTSADAYAAVKAGQHAILLDQNKPGQTSEWKALLGHEWVGKSFTYSPPIMNPADPVATTNAISRTSDNPEEAMRLLEMLNTDIPFYNLICKGIEDKHWVWDDEDLQVIKFPDGVSAENAGYNPNTDWEFGNQFNAYFVDRQQAIDDVWNKTRELNERAVPSAAMGFNFNAESVETEIAQIASVIQEFHTPLNYGLIDPADAIPQFIDKLKAAGVDAVLEETQRQLDAWAAG